MYKSLSYINFQKFIAHVPEIGKCGINALLAQRAIEQASFMMMMSF